MPAPAPSLAAAPFFADVAEAPEGAEPLWLKTNDGLRLRAVVWARGRRGTAFVFSGRSEYVEKYGRVITRLAARDLSVVAWDWRGQGLSTRLSGAPMLGHVDDFRAYQRDWDAVRTLARQRALPEPFLMVAHSMGGCIGLRTLIEGADFAAALLSAPMWHLQMRAATRQVATSLAQLAQLIGFGPRRLPGTNRAPSALALAFENNVLTSDPEHFAWFGQQLGAHPELGLGGPSVQWTYAALEEMARLYVGPLPALPILAFLGSEEHIVSATVVRIQTKKMPRARLVTLEGARHEVWMERPGVQERVWAATDTFLAERWAEPRASAAADPGRAALGT